MFCHLKALNSWFYKITTLNIYLQKYRESKHRKKLIENLKFKQWDEWVEMNLVTKPEFHVFHRPPWWKGRIGSIKFLWHVPTLNKFISNFMKYRNMLKLNLDIATLDFQNPLASNLTENWIFLRKYSV